MAFVLTINCGSCSFRDELFTDSNRCYQLEKGSLALVYTRLGWCFSCNRVVEAEDLISEKEIVEELKSAASEEPFDLAMWHQTRMKEYWANMEEYENYQDKVRDGLVRILGWPLKKVSRNEYLTGLRTMLQWRSDRRSEPKCLVCAGTGIRYLEEDKKSWGWITHPGCGGRIEVECHQRADVALSLSAYSPEGHRLSKIA